MKAEIRPAVVQDIGFITDAWLRAARDSNWGRGVPNSMYYHFQHKVMEHLLRRCYVRVAFLPFPEGMKATPERPDYIVGFVVYENDPAGTVIHMTLVRDEKDISFLRQGIGDQLVEYAVEHIGKEQVFYTCNTPIFAKSEFREKMRDRRYVFNPYLLIETLPCSFAEDIYVAA